jgi:hypothetical protein
MYSHSRSRELTQVYWHQQVQHGSARILETQLSCLIISHHLFTQTRSTISPSNSYLSSSCWRLHPTSTQHRCYLTILALRECAWKSDKLAPKSDAHSTTHFILQYHLGYLLIGTVKPLDTTCLTFAIHSVSEPRLCSQLILCLSTPSSRRYLRYIGMASSGASTSTIPIDDQGFQEVLGCGRRTKDTERMNALIQAEAEDDGGNERPTRSNRRSRRATKKHVVTAANDDSNFFSSLPVEEGSDADDDDFMGELCSESSTESSSSGSDRDINSETRISNAEVCYFQINSLVLCLNPLQLAAVLPTKTVPLRGGHADPNARHLRKKSKTSKRKPTAGETSSAAPQPSKRARVEDTDDASQPLSSHVSKSSKPRRSTHPIYLFYEEISKNAHGIEGNPGDKHYQCFHGQRKILTITKAMRSSLNGKCHISGFSESAPNVFRERQVLLDTSRLTFQLCIDCIYILRIVPSHLPKTRLQLHLAKRLSIQPRQLSTC